MRPESNAGFEPTPDPFRGTDGDPVVPDGWSHATLTTNDITISYYTVGDPDDPPIVLAHGLFEDARCMRWVVDDLVDDYHVIAYDARGHGHSDAPADGYDLENRVLDLDGVLAALEVEAPILYGHSMGGSTVAKFAAEHPERVTAVVLEDPAGIRWPPEFDLEAVADDVAEDVRDDLEKSFDELLAAYTEAEDEEADEVDSEGGEERPDDAGHDDIDDVNDVDDVDDDSDVDHADDDSDVDHTDDGGSEADGDDVAEIPRALRSTFARSDQRMSEHVVEILRTGYADLEATFPEIEAPVLVLRRDVGVEERVRDLEIAEGLVDGRLVHIPDAGHHVVLTAPDAALREIRTFVERINRVEDGLASAECYSPTDEDQSACEDV